jgi:hypothetical protein
MARHDGRGKSPCATVPAPCADPLGMA